MLKHFESFRINIDCICVLKVTKCFFFFLIFVSLEKKKKHYVDLICFVYFAYKDIILINLIIFERRNITQIYIW